MGKASKRRRLAQQQQPPRPEQGPSGQLLAGLGVALLVVVVVILVAGGGGLGQTSSMGGNPTAAAPAVPVVDASRVRVLEDAAKANPTNKAPMIELGNLYYDADRYTEAVLWYARALELDPGNTDVRTDMATAYFYTGDTARAIAEGRKVLAQDPNKPQARLNIGIWLVNQSPPNTAEAVEHWQTVIRVYPGTDFAKQAQSLIDKYKK